MRAGASGYLLKGARKPDILRAIRGVTSGEAIFGPAIAQRLMQYFAAPTPGAAGTCSQPAFPDLAEREREIPALIAAGRSNQEIAQRTEQQSVAAKCISLTQPPKCSLARHHRTFEESVIPDDCFAVVLEACIPRTRGEEPVQVGQHNGRAIVDTTRAVQADCRPMIRGLSVKRRYAEHRSGARMSGDRGQPVGAGDTAKRGAISLVCLRTNDQESDDSLHGFTGTRLGRPSPPDAAPRGSAPSFARSHQVVCLAAHRRFQSAHGWTHVIAGNLRPG